MENPKRHGESLKNQLFDKALKFNNNDELFYLSISQSNSQTN